MTFSIDERGLIEKLEISYLPLYVALFRKVPWAKYPAVIQMGVYLLVLVAMLAMHQGIVWFGKVTEYMPVLEWWIYFFVGAVIFIFGIWALGYVYYKTKEFLPTLLAILTSTEQLSKLESALRFMYVSKYQLVTVVVFTGIVGILANIQPLELSMAMRLELTLCVSLAAIVCGWGLWLAFSSTCFIREIGRLGELKVNPLFPAKTPGLADLANLMAVYSTLFALEVSLWVVPFIIISKFGTVAELIGNSPQFWFATIFIYFFAGSIVPLYFWYPQLTLRRIVINWKAKLLHEIGSRIEQQWVQRETGTSEVLRQISEYGRIFRLIDQSPNLLLNLNPLVRTISSIILAMFTAYLANPELALMLLNSVRQLIP